VLIVITGDHETGALTLRNAGSAQLHVELLANQKASRDVLASLTRRFIRENAGGDNGEEMTFEQIKPFITEMSGLIFSETQQPRAGNLVLTASEVRELEANFATSQAAVLANQSAGRDVLAHTMVRLLNNKAGLHWGHGDHSALPTQTSAWGNQAAQIIHGMRHLTCIGERLKPTVKPLSVQQHISTLLP
jgi:alkaline phosphatase